MWLKSRLCVFISIHGHRHAHLFLSVLFTPSLYFFLKSFFHLFLIPAMVPDENSMEDPLCNSSFGSMVSLDYVTPDTIQEFDSKWDGILLSMTKILHDEILEGLYKLRIRESEKLKTILEFYDLETHQKKLGPDYHRLKTMVKRSIEQEIRNNNFGSRNGNFEKNAVVKNQGTKQRVQRIL